MRNIERLKKDAKQIFQSVINAVNPQTAVMNRLRLEGNSLKADDRSYSLGDYKRIWISGIGNYTAHMSKAVEEMLGDRVDGGVVVTRYTHGFTLEKTEVLEAGFPVPDLSGMTATRKVRALLEEAGQDCLVIFLLSKGAPSLSTLPVEPISLADKLKTTSLLRKGGADMRELYTVQKHLSASKGGQVARWAYPATMLALILSDLLEDDLSLVCSGLTVADETTFEQARAILQKYGLTERLPESVVGHVEAGVKGDRQETPKASDKVFDRVENLIVGSNLMALEAAEKGAQALGYNTMIFPSFLQGEAREMGPRYAGLVRQVKSSGRPVSPPACLLFGGETRVTVNGTGRGGANQEVALAAAIELAGTEDFTLLQGSTTGCDGNSDASGAIIDGETVQRAARLGLDPRASLENNDSYNLFRRTGETLAPGATDTDVKDVGIILVQS